MSDRDNEEHPPFTPATIRFAERQMAEFWQLIERAKREDSKQEGRLMNNFTGERVQLELSRDEYDHLLMVLGYAIGAATRGGDPDFKHQAIRVANAINKGNPAWRPYEVPQLERP